MLGRWGGALAGIGEMALRLLHGSAHRRHIIFSDIGLLRDFARPPVGGMDVHRDRHCLQPDFPPPPGPSRVAPH